MAKMGGSRTFFTIYANMQTNRLIQDAKASAVVMQAVFLDAIEGVLVGFEEFFGAYNRLTDEIITNGRAVDEARIHYEKYFTGAIADAKELEAQLVRTGAAFNKGAQESIEAGAQMARIQENIGGARSAAGAVEASMLLGAVGEMSVDESMQRMISLHQQTGYMIGGYTEAQFKALDAEEQRLVVMNNNMILLNQLNEVSNRSNANINQISESMNRYASTAALANMSLSEQVALSAALIEQGENEGRAGTSLKMILTRLATNRSENNELLREYGIEVRDQNGDLRKLTDILTEINDIYYELDGTQQMQLATSIAGAHHTDRFVKLVTSSNRVLELQAIALDSSGSAFEEFGVYLATPSYQLGVLEQQIEALNDEIYQRLIPAEVIAAKTTLALTDALNDMTLRFDGETGAISQFMAVGDATFRFIQGTFGMALAFQMVNVGIKTYTQMLMANAEAHEDLFLLQGAQITQAAPANMARTQIIHKMKEEHLTVQQLMEMKELAGLSEVNTLNVIGSTLNSLTGQKKIDGAISADMFNKEKVHLDSTALGYKQVRGEVAQYVAQQYKANYVDSVTAANRIAGLAQSIEKQKQEIGVHRIKGSVQANINKQEAGYHMAMVEMGEARMAVMEAEKQKLFQFSGLNKKLKMDIARVDKIATDSEVAGATNKTYIYNMMNDLEKLNIPIKDAKIKLQNLENRAVNQAAIEYFKAANNQQKFSFGTYISGKIAEATANKMQFLQRSMMGLSNAAMMASFAVYLFADAEDAAEAQMLLMMFSMVPMMVQLFAMDAQVKSLTLSMLLLKTSMSVVAGLALAGAMVVVASQFDLLQSDIEASDYALGEFSDTFGDIQFGDGGGFQTGMEEITSSIDSATDAMSKFDDMRLSVFFGGDKGAMNKAMFNEIKQNGVENLYFQPEVHIVNNFHGLTGGEAAGEIAAMVREELLTQNNAQMLDV